MSLMSSMWILPALVGPAYASFTAAALGWRWSLVLLLPVLFAARFLVARRVSAFHGTPAVRRGLPLTRALLLAGSMFLFLSGSGAHDLWGVTRLVLGLACVLYALHGIFPQGTFRARRGPEAAVLAMFLVCFTFYGGESLVTLMATQDLGASLFQAGLALTFGALCRSSASLLLPRLLARPHVTSTGVTRVGAALIVLAFALVAVDIATAHRGLTAMWLTWPSWAVGGFGMGLVYTPVAVASMGIASRRGAGNTAGAVVLAETVGALLGMACGSTLAVSHIAGIERLDHTGPAFAFFALTGLPLLLITPRLVAPDKAHEAL